MRACLLLTALVVATVTGCPNDPEGCEAICDWYLQFCDEDRATCLDDCAWADSATFNEAGACVEDTPADCRAASCCVEFAYDAYNFERECLGLLDEQRDPDDAP